MQQTAWQDEGTDQISATRDELTLIIRKFDRGARYIVLERHCGDPADPGMMLESGTADDVDAAILAATSSAGRISSFLTERRRKRTGTA